MNLYTSRLLSLLNYPMNERNPDERCLFGRPSPVNCSDLGIVWDPRWSVDFWYLPNGTLASPTVLLALPGAGWEDWTFAWGWGCFTACTSSVTSIAALSFWRAVNSTQKNNRTSQRRFLNWWHYIYLMTEMYSLEHRNFFGVYETIFTIVFNKGLRQAIWPQCLNFMPFSVLADLHLHPARS